MTGFDYGNTRLRVRAASWLSAAGYRGLLAASSLDGLLGSLAQLDYSEDVSAAMSRHQGIRRLDETVRTHLSRELGDVLSFYSGGVADRLRVLLSRWDLRNVRSILRDLAGRRQQSPGTATLVAAGAFDARTLEEIAAQRDVRAAVDLLSVWGLPSPGVVRHLRHALPAFTESGDVLVLEDALDRALGELAAADRGEGDRVSDLLSREVDRVNLMSLLRLRADPGLTGVVAHEPIAGGAVHPEVWSDLAAVDDSALGSELATRVDPIWRPALSAWSERRDLPRLDTDLDHAAALESIACFRRGDPLGIDVPIGYIGQQEAQAANLRLIGRAVSHDLDRNETFDRLLGVVA
jgi:vacuolar-type H+-ATPase subunit C/Vma6